MMRRVRLALATVVIAAAILTPTSSGADADGSADGAVDATPQCAQGYTYDSVSGDCEKHETQPARASCPATIGGHAVEVSSSDCVTTTAHTTLPTYSCNTAERWALVGNPPECQRTVTRQVTTTRTVTDMVHYTETYTERVKTVITEHVPYTVRKRVAPFTVRVRVPPLTKTYMAMEPYTYTVRVRYCVTWAVVVGQSVCTKHGYRNEQRTGMRETLITEPAYHYENRPAYNYRTEQVCCKPVTRTVYKDVTRTRQVCCKPVTRTVTTTRTVRETQSAVPSASCAVTGYSLNSSSRCERPAGARLGAVTHSCASGWTAASGDSSTCERTLSQDPTWTCAAGHSIDRATTPPHCHPDPEEDDEEEGGTEEDEENDPECTTALSTLGSGTVTRSGSWATGCESVHKSTDQVPYYAWRFTFTVTGAATLDLDAVSAGDPHVYITDSDGTVVGSDDDSGVDGRDSRIRGLSLTAGTYTIEVTTGSDRLTGSFTLTLKLTVAAAAVSISGFADAEATPVLGKTAAVVTSEFTVAPADATCTAAPAGAMIAPATGASRTVRLSVVAATRAIVTVTCTKGAHSDTATAKFKANPAPVSISGFDDASAPAGDADSAVVSEDFEVTPADAICTATPAGTKIAPVTGGTRTVTLEVDKGKTVAVKLTCVKGGQLHRETAKFTATRLGGCTTQLGAFGSGGVKVQGTLSAQGDCTSAHRRADTGGDHHARRHVLKLEKAGWVTVTLKSASSNRWLVDMYLLILDGDTADGSGTVVASNDDQCHHSDYACRGRYGGSHRDSRIVRKLLAAGTYTIEATTYHAESDGDYVLRVNVEYPPTADQPERLKTEVGTAATASWSYTPPAATVKIALPLPANLTASISAVAGQANFTASTSRTGDYTVTVGYTSGPGSLSKSTEIVAYSGNCPVSLDGARADQIGVRARQVHHHRGSTGHRGCQAHTPPDVCEGSYQNPWTPRDGGHGPRDLKGCNGKNNSGIIGTEELELLPWTPYDVDHHGNPVICEDAKNMGFGDVGRKALEICLKTHKLAVITWSSGFDIVQMLVEYVKDHGRKPPASVRQDWLKIQQRLEEDGTVLVGTADYTRELGSVLADDALVKALCKGAVEYVVDKGVKASAKKVGGWARKSFPSAVLKAAQRLTLLLGLAQDVLGVAYQALASDVACD